MQNLCNSHRIVRLNVYILVRKSTLLFGKKGLLFWLKNIEAQRNDRFLIPPKNTQNLKKHWLKIQF